MTIQKRTASTGLCAALFLCACGLAPTAPAPPAVPPPATGTMPPAAAFTACEGHDEGELVSIDGLSSAAITATCTVIEGRLVAVPSSREEAP